MRICVKLYQIWTSYSRDVKIFVLLALVVIWFSLPKPFVVQQSETICAILIESIMGNISVTLF